jgi:hypothetical protein
MLHLDQLTHASYSKVTDSTGPGRVWFISKYAANDVWFYRIIHFLVPELYVSECVVIAYVINKTHEIGVDPLF